MKNIKLKKTETFLLGDLFRVETGKGVAKENRLSAGEYEIIGANGCIGYTNNFLIEGKHILTGRVGTLGELNFINRKVWPSDNVLIISPKEGNCHIEFLYHYLKTIDFKSLNVGSTQPLITQTDIKSLKISLPDENKQKQIAEILSSLEDKIELNRRINANLETMASALFKKWFVDIGDELPKGWRMRTLGEVINIVYGKGLSTDKLLKIGYPVFGGNGVIGFHDKFLYDEPQIIIGCRGAGSGNIKQTYPKSFVTNNSLVLEIPKDSDLNRFYLKYFLRTVDITEFVTGSAQPQITIENLKHLKVLIPSLETLRKFSDMISEFDKLSLNNEMENKNLEITRDSLLPRLMSGKIRII